MAPADVDEPGLDVQRCGSVFLPREDPAPDPDLVAVREQRQGIQAGTVGSTLQSPPRVGLLEYEATVRNGRSARHNAIPPQALDQVEFEIESDQFASRETKAFGEDSRIETLPTSLETL